ncbi:TetR family transcriptional regulator [Aldersonia kunmingensis]|uniref:TetR family transcriptional regulator n=1 Tax=Aldersonia kunmingensis TaxID=408066 RepID=UPI000830C9F2|nr:TetR family transcriptional regulator [Aldersonia kunmingensis]
MTRANSDDGAATATRAQRKEQTRQQLLDATLELSRDRGFAAVSLREITKSVGIVPTAFYRHFKSVDELGLAIVDEGIRELRLTLRAVRRNPAPADAARSMDVLFEHVRNKRELFRFLFRERYGGSREVTAAIASELRLIVRELATDLSRVPALDTWSDDDLDMTAGLFVAVVQDGIADFVSVAEPDGRADGYSAAEKAIVERAVRQLRLVMLGMGGWRPRA